MTMVRCLRMKSNPVRDPSRMFERLDANDDGMVSAEEFAEARMGDRGGKRGGPGGGKRHGGGDR